jgi:hypothetical protein
MRTVLRPACVPAVYASFQRDPIRRAMKTLTIPCQRPATVSMVNHSRGLVPATASPPRRLPMRFGGKGSCCGREQAGVSPRCSMTCPRIALAIPIGPGSNPAQFLPVDRLAIQTDSESVHGGWSAFASAWRPKNVRLRACGRRQIAASSIPSDPRVRHHMADVVALLSDYHEVFTPNALGHRGGRRCATVRRRSGMWSTPLRHISMSRACRSRIWRVIRWADSSHWNWLDAAEPPPRAPFRPGVSGRPVTARDRTHRRHSARSCTCAA